jgi:hypothetical protein
MHITMTKFHAFVSSNDQETHELDSQAESFPTTRRQTLLWIFFGTVLAAIALRLLFFEGLEGGDDLDHVRFATLWDRMPANHWETRLLYNTLLRASILVFGHHELAYAAPSLLASVILVASCVWCAGRLSGGRAALMAGLIAAALPADIIYSTVPIAGPLSVGLAAMGTTLLLMKDRPYAAALGCFILALSILAHPFAIFYVGALACGLFIAASTWPERGRAVVHGLMAIVLFAVFELTLFTVIAGDPFYEFRTIVHTHLQVTQTLDFTFPEGWFTWPIQSWLFSKDLGLALSLVCVLACLNCRRLPPPLKALTVTIVVYWLWIGYGTQSPTTYQAFPRMPRFYHILAMPVAVLLGSLLAVRGRLGILFTTVVIALGTVLVAGSGSWGQRIEITRELLPYIRAHPHTLFLTDDRIPYQLFILNQCREIPNIADWDEVPSNFDRPAAVLLNPLNRRPLPQHLKLGKVLYTTKEVHRPIAALIPPAIVREHAWFVRRPPGQIVQLAGAESLQ